MAQLKKMNIKLSNAQLYELMRSIDKDKNGRIDYQVHIFDYEIPDNTTDSACNSGVH